MEVEEMAQIDEAEYKVVLAKLEDQSLAEFVEKSDEFKVIRQAWDEIYKKTQCDYNTLDHTLPDAKLKAMQCQVALQFYENVLQTTIDRYKIIGEEAYTYAKEQGWLGTIMLWLKNR